MEGDLSAGVKLLNFVAHVLEGQRLTIDSLHPRRSIRVTYGQSQDSPQHVMEGDLPAGMQLLNLVAHVLEEQAVLLQVHLQASLQQTQQEPHAVRWYQTLQRTYVHHQQCL